MFSVYAVKLKSGHKNRFYIGTYESFEEAKHVCNCCTCGDADYAYAKELKSGATVFFLRRPGYQEFALPDNYRPKIRREDSDHPFWRDPMQPR